MDRSMLPTIKFEVEGMQAAIISALGCENSKLGESIKKETINAVNNYPFKETVNFHVKKAIDRSIESYFSRFDNGGSYIQNAVFEFLDKKLKNLDKCN